MINVIDLFAGCGGLTEGFKRNGNFKTIACVEWDKLPYQTLLHRFKTRWGYADAERRILRFDIQRVGELLNGWNDIKYGQSEGLDAIVAEHGGKVDVIVGGPPCQAYSVAGRIQDKDGMRNDYRNYLFEKYLDIVKHYRPKVFVFENVPGILSAAPGDGKERIIEIIRKKFLEAGYATHARMDEAVIDLTEYGVPQNRKRIIILGVCERHFGSKAGKIVEKFYNDILPKYKVKKKRTVREAIGDLPKLIPLDGSIMVDGKRVAHSSCSDQKILNHRARYNSKRELDVFRLLTEDLASGRNEYTSVQKLKELYTSLTGKNSNIHKYYVLRWDAPSNTIPAHLYKDGLRHIHPDSEQLRTITVREAARLQTFPDDFEFISGTNMDYKIIGNAVPPLFAEILAKAICEVMEV